MSAATVESKPPSKLSFAAYNGEKITKFWNEETSGLYHIDCARGREIAAELMRYITENQAPMVLQWVLEGMGDLRSDGMKIGFVHQISEFAMAGFTSARATGGVAGNPL